MLTDNELLSRLADLSKTQAKAECEILAYLIEVSRRELHLKKAYRSLFEFIRVHLKCSETTAGRRTAVVRAAIKFPVVLDFIREQRLTLTSLAMISPHLRADNHHDLLAKIEGMTTRQIENLVTDFSPRKARRDSIRPIAVAPEPSAGCKDEKIRKSTFQGEALVLGVEDKNTSRIAKVRMAFDAPAELAEKIERLKEIHAHKLKDGSLAEVLEMAVDMLLERTAPEREVKKSPRAQRKESRRPPATIRHEVWKRDGGQCTL